MKIILNPYKDPTLGKDWNEQKDEIKQELNGIIQELPERVDCSINELNLGAGADWPTIAVTIGFGFFAIPEAHKRIREALEEWAMIGERVKALIQKLSKSNSLVSEPLEILFIEASEKLLSLTNQDDAIFLGYYEVQQIGSNENIHGVYDFLFEINNEEWKVVIDGLKIIKTITKV